MVDLFSNVINEDRISKMSSEELKVLAKILDIDNEKKPDWYDIKGIKFIWHNTWSDPEVQYNGKLVNATEIEDCMWEEFYEETGSENRDEFAKYMRDNAERVKELIEGAKT